ncbi:MAG: phytoene/squalene synthase family protein [Polyangiaceae bacterium]
MIAADQRSARFPRTNGGRRVTTELGLPGDVDACHALLSRGSKSFSSAGRLLPKRARDASAVLYAFCRVADDAVDLDDSADRVERLRRRLCRVYAGDGLDGPVERAFADLVRVHDLPIAVFDALLEGFEWDVTGRSYETLSDTLAYAARVASTVGAAMTAIMGRREPYMIARACDLGLAMQLTNIARDVGEDARNGRVYLPAEWLRAEGVSPADLLRDPRPLPGVTAAVLRLLEAADDLYARADAGIAALPSDVRPAIYAARYIYADIGRVIRAHQGDSVTGRAVVSGARKATLLGRALITTWSAPGEALYAPPAPEVNFLVDALARAPQTS